MNKFLPVCRSLFKNRMTLLTATVLVTLSLPFLAHGSDQKEDLFVSDYWSIQLENDFFAVSGDKQYTHGTEFSRLLPGTGPHWLSNLGRWLPFYHLSAEASAVNYFMGQKIFTPEDLSEAELIPDDRSYAGYLFVGVALLSRCYRDDHLETGNMLEVTVGIVGPDSGASRAQKWFHDLIDGDEPMGWDNQLDNEPCLDISYTRLWKIAQPALDVLQFDVSPHITIELGNVYTYAAGGVMFRVGNNLGASFAPPNIRPGFPGVPYFKNSLCFSWYLFAGHESRVVFRNIFLDGNTFSDSHSVDKERIVGDHQFGLAFHQGRWRAALSIMSRTREFSTQEELTRYGALNLSWTF